MARSSIAIGRIPFTDKRPVRFRYGSQNIATTVVIKIEICAHAGIGIQACLRNMC